MTVISNASPLINLARIGKLDLLHELYGDLTIPEAVWREVVVEGAGQLGADGRVSFNWRIIMAPKRLVEYVVAHELCHLKYNDHSRDFWRLLERAMPDYERRRAELAVVGPKFDLPKVPTRQ